MFRVIRLGLIMVASMVVPSIAHASDALHWSYFQLIPGAEKIPSHILGFTFVFILITLISIIGGSKFRKMLKTDPMPSPKFGLLNILETIIGTTISMLEEIVGHNGKKYLPLLGTLAIVILFSNMMGLIPGMNLPTANLNTNLAMAATVFILYHSFGFKEHGIRYLNQFFGGLSGPLKWIMAPLMVPIELISHFVRPMSLSIRLFGNMHGDHLVLGTFMALISIPLIYPIAIQALGFVVIIVQTFVFCMLTMVYISLAISHEH